MFACRVFTRATTCHIDLAYQMKIESNKSLQEYFYSLCLLFFVFSPHQSKINCLLDANVLKNNRVEVHEEWK